MKALTLWQPWAWAVVTGQKEIENRPWATARILGERIAIHAGKVYDPKGEAFLRQHNVIVSHNVPLSARVSGAIVGSVTVVACARRQPDRLMAKNYLANYGEPADPRFRKIVGHEMFFGPWGWLLEGARELAVPIPCKGALSLWDLGAEISEKVLA